MGKYITLLVMGDRHNVRLYDSDYSVGEKVTLKSFDEVRSEKKSILSELRHVGIRLSESGMFDCEWVRNTICSIESMSDVEYLVNFNPDCEIDDYGNIVFSKPDVRQYYRHAKCYEDRLMFNGEEPGLVQPFILKNGGKSYSAEKGAIDFSMVHGFGKDRYLRVWELCVDGSEPMTDDEKGMRDAMVNRDAYFSHFVSGEEYATFSTSFWCHGVILEDGSIEFVEKGCEKEWAETFYDRFVLPASDKTLFTLYDAVSI